MNSKNKAYKDYVKVKCMKCGHKKGLFNNKAQTLICAKCKGRFVYRTEQADEEVKE